MKKLFLANLGNSALTFKTVVKPGEGNIRTALTTIFAHTAFWHFWILRNVTVILNLLWGPSTLLS